MYGYDAEENQDYFFLNNVLSICLHEKESCIFIYVVCMKYIDTIAGIVININMILIAVLIMKNG